MRFAINFFGGICTVLVTMVWSAPANADLPSFTPFVAQPQSEKYQSWYETFIDGGQLKTMANVLSKNIKLPTPLLLVVEECGKVNAFYHRGKRTITMCYEILDQINEKMEAKTKHDIFRGTQSSEIMGKLWAGAFTFILMHEVGHALVHVLELPVLGREEDAADQIAAYFFLATVPPALPGTQSAFLTGALWYWEPETLFNIYTKSMFSDEHSMNPQRQANFACWAYGKDPDRFQYVVKYLTKARAVQCGYEYAQLETSVHKLLGKNVRLPD